MQQALDATRAEVVVALTPFYARVKQAQGRTAVRLVVATSIKEYLPPALRILFTLLKERKDGHRITLQTRDLRYGQLLKRHAGAARPAVPVGPDDRAVILSSGGTTGTPKGVVGLHRHYVAAGLQLQEWTRSARTPWTDVIMLPLPMFHVYGNVGVQPLAFLGPHPLSLVPNPRDLNDLLATIKQVKPAFFNGVPTLYTAILNHPSVQSGRLDLRSIRVCFSGAAALMAETKRQFEEKTGARIIEGYSLTEGMMACCVNPVQGTNKLGSIGMPLSDVEVRIVDAEKGEQPMARGETGEMIMRAPQYMAEYWNNPLETNEALRVHGDGERWLYTGDLAYLDEDGYIFLVDRKKDLIKTSGFQVWPREIEEVLSAHPAVMEVGVAGIPDPLKGEVAKAWVVLKAGADATEDALRAYCKERLAPYKVPAAVEFRKELPKTMVGKILRRALAAEAPASL
jgi:long-chain acyl-CoA synthetase